MKQSTKRELSFFKFRLLLLTFLAHVAYVVVHLVSQRVSCSSSERRERQIVGVEVERLVKPSFLQVIRQHKNANGEEHEDKDGLDDPKGDSLASVVMFKEPADLQQRICDFGQTDCVNDVKLFANFERVVEKSRDGQKMMKLHDWRLPVYEAPYEIKSEVTHAVSENQR